VRGDPGRLRQVVLNLLSNALKFTEKGEVVLRVTCAQPREARALVLIEVIDSGIGISRENQTKLFEAFTQADSSTTRRYGGTGLGLAISRQLVTLMGGEIGVQSEVNQGARFWIKLPLEAQEPVAKPLDLATEQAGVVRALIVDDNATQRATISRLLATKQVRGEIEATAAAALARLQKAAADGTPYHLVLIDQQMPEGEGLALVRAIKALPALTGMRLVLMTPQGVVDSDALKMAGVDACLSKPIKHGQLWSLLPALGGKARGSRKVGGGATPPLSALPPLRILLAEDNLVNQKVAVGLLRKLGAPVTVVANGLEALAALADTPFDVVLMDCHMPEMDGYEAAQAIRKREKEPDCPWKSPLTIIALTADAMQGDREKCLGAGMNDYLTKPMQLSVLHAALSRCLPLPQNPTTTLSASSA
jgi:CheY-like chemotaxis protein